MSGAPINAAVLQLRVTMDVAANVGAMERLLVQLPAYTLAVAPEGALSGYLPQAGFISGIDQSATRKAIEHIASLCQHQSLHLVAGACLNENGAWRNTALYFSPRGERARYDKINLAQSERPDFTAGSTLPVFDIDIDGQAVRLGIQMCREIRYPEQWRALADQRAQVIAYVNNAVGSKTGDAVWRALMISRAAETQRFILGANNAAADQTCPSMIVAPSGAILNEVQIGAEDVASATLDLTQVSNWNISQARDDVVQVALRSAGPG